MVKLERGKNGAEISFIGWFDFFSFLRIVSLSCEQTVGRFISRQPFIDIKSRKSARLSALNCTLLGRIRAAISNKISVEVSYKVYLIILRKCWPVSKRWNTLSKGPAEFETRVDWCSRVWKSENSTNDESRDLVFLALRWIFKYT